MKLAEALNERKALKDTLARLMERLEANARVQEGDQPAEAPADLLAAVTEVLAALEILVVRVNRTNLVATLADGRSLMESIARRDMLHLRRAALDRLVKAAGTPRDRWALTRDEIRRVVTVDVAALQREIDTVSAELRRLDTALQQANWSVDLAD